MKAIELFPYWADNRALLMDVVDALKDEDLDLRPSPNLRSLGEVLRHVISAEEYWWHGGILGEPYERWRPAEWEQLNEQARAEHRRQRFPTTRVISDGLRAAHAPVEAFLGSVDAADLCEKRRATWGEDNTLRWILWHLVEHDQHHRAQICTRLRMHGRASPRIWPRPGVMGATPARTWRAGEVDPADVVPFWKPLHATLRRAAGTLTDDDLTFTHAPGRPTIHDLLLHVFIWEDFLIRQNLGGQMGVANGAVQGWFWKSDVGEMSRNVGPYFPTVAAVIAGMDAVHASTRAFLDTLTAGDLVKTIQTPGGPESWHHLLWYAREHAVHHRAQLFLRMRMAGRTPPEI